jgi:hypothetical protein
MKDEMAEWSRWCFKDTLTMTGKAVAIYGVLLVAFWTLVA